MIGKLLDKYKSMSKQMKVVFWFTFVGFLQRGISVITTPIFTRVLSTDDYGLFSVFNAYYTVIIIVVTLYLHMGVVNKRGKCIVTSNIPADNVYLQTKYRDLLNDVEAVKDNAGLMALKFLMINGVSTFYLAGFDGYAHDVSENYADSSMAFITRNAVLDAINRGMETVLRQFSSTVHIEFLTLPKYVMIQK